MNQWRLSLPVSRPFDTGVYARSAAILAVSVAAYWLAAELGMIFVLERAHVSLLWPAAGLALALTCRLGPCAALGSGLGAALVHLGPDTGPVAATGLGAGVAVAAWLGAAILRRMRARLALDRARDVLALLVVGAVPASGVSSLVAAGVLWLAGITQWSGFTSLWWICWVADFMGILLVAPALLVPVPRCLCGAEWLEKGAMLAATVLAATVIYGDLLPPDTMLGRPLAYAIFPLVIWSALRAGPSTTAWLLLVHAAMAVAYTAADLGPFAHGQLSYELLSLHAHLVMVSLTGLLLAASIAGRCRAEEQAREYLHELSHAGRVSAMGEMAGGLAHELNQPLCAIATYAQAARRLMAGRSEPDLERALTRIDESAQRAGGIIRQMRGFVRGGTPEMEVRELSEVIREGLALTAGTVRQAGVRLTLDLAGGLPPVRVAPVQIHQVLVNLVRNAVTALGQVPPERRHLAVTTTAGEDGRVRVSLADSGPGIPEALRDELFEPFVTSGGDGMGLGLSISRSIVEHHGGKLTVTDRPGGGTVFHFDLPAAPRRQDDGE